MPCQIVHYSVTAGYAVRRQNCSPVHPLGKSPVITDNGNTIAESGAITEYILDTYGEGRLIPPSEKNRSGCAIPTGCATRKGSAMPPLLLKLLVQR